MSMEEGVEEVPVKSWTGHLADQLPALVWIVTPDGSIVYANRRWCDYTGLSVKETHGTDWTDAAYPDDIPNLLKNWRMIQASGLPGEMEMLLRRSDGDFRWFRFNVSPMPDHTGEAINWCGVGVDVHDQKRAIEKSAIENDFRLIVESVPVPVAVTTPAGEVEALNQATLDYFGKSFEELKTWTTTDSVHPDDLDRTIAAYVAAHESGGSYNVESRHRRSDRDPAAIPDILHPASRWVQ